LATVSVTVIVPAYATVTVTDVTAMAASIVQLLPALKVSVSAAIRGPVGVQQLPLLLTSVAAVLHVGSTPPFQTLAAAKADPPSNATLPPTHTARNRLQDRSLATLRCRF
jgi:hypothetical protein